MTRIFLAAALVAVAGFAAPAQAQGQAASEPRPMMQAIGPNSKLETYLDLARNSFLDLDVDGDGRLTEADVDLHAAMQRAQVANMGAMVIMRADLNGDGVVTTEELDRLLAYEKRRKRGPGFPGANEPQAADTDGDGRITWTEALAFAVSRGGAMFRGVPEAATRISSVKRFDADGDGAISVDEFAAAHEAHFRSIDTDGDNAIAPAEMAAFNNQAQAEAAKQREAQRLANEQRAAAERKRKENEARAACALPKASAAAKVIVLSGYNTQTLSTVALGTPDEVTETATLTVEPGAEPLYVVISSYSAVIWRFTGAVERIERVALASFTTMEVAGKGIPMVGVVGVAADRVSFLPNRNCLPHFQKAPTIDSAKTVAHVTRETGKAPNIVATDYALYAVALPSGVISKPDLNARRATVLLGKNSVAVPGGSVNGASPALIAEMFKFSPGGIVEVDAKSVVGSVEAKDYDVLPQEAGLVQLVQSGALTRSGNNGEYLIRRKIRYPAGLAGSHAVKFLLMKGVPEPDGDSGHSHVVSEETGETISGSP